jgi:hypothetical protein
MEKPTYIDLLEFVRQATADPIREGIDVVDPEEPPRLIEYWNNVAYMGP